MKSIDSGSKLVPRITLFCEFRAAQIRQGKAQAEGNGRFPLPRTATPHWRIWAAPFGQDDKRPSALLRSFALASASPAFARLASGRLSPC